MNKLTRVVAASLAAGAIAGAFGLASAAEFSKGEGDHSGGGHGSSGSVSQADFYRLQGQVQELERRVSALEQGGGHNGGAGSPKGAGKGTGKGHTAGDSWEGR